MRETTNRGKGAVEAARRGDLEQFGLLYERYYRPMVALSYSVLGDLHLAEDAAQEAFAQACPRLGQLRHPEKFGPWLAEIARNVARKMARSHAKHAGNHDVSDLVDRSGAKSENHALRRAIGQLPESAREVIMLRYFDRLSYERIGAILGISPQAVNGRLLRAKRRLAWRFKCEQLTGSEL